MPNKVKMERKHFMKAAKKRLLCFDSIDKIN